MIGRIREAWGRLSEMMIVRTVWYLLLIVLTIIAYEGEVPFVYAQF